MSDVQELKEKLEHQRPACWGELPDIPLYMDQVTSYMRRQTIRFDDEDVITSAMINNYIKAGLLPRANGKRYSKEHLTKLITIACMKQVLSVKDMVTSVNDGKERENYDIAEMYSYFQSFLDEALRDASTLIVDSDDRSEVLMMATRCTLHAYAYKLAAERLLNIMRDLDAKAQPPEETT